MAAGWLTVTVGWLAALRSGVLLGSPLWLAWVLIAGTVVIPFWTVRRLSPQ
jgi:hypothetical protein